MHRMANDTLTVPQAAARIRALLRQRLPHAERSLRRYCEAGFAGRKVGTLWLIREVELRGLANRLRDRKVGKPPRKSNGVPVPKREK